MEVSRPINGSEAEAGGISKVLYDSNLGTLDPCLSDPLSNPALQMHAYKTRQMSSIDTFLGFDEHVIYSVLHEPLYCQGAASNWSADRLIQELPRFDHTSDSSPIYFSGEVILSGVFEDYVELRELKEVANILAETNDWPALYDERQLRHNEVPVYAANFIHDREFDTAKVQPRRGPPFEGADRSFSVRGFRFRDGDGRDHQRFEELCDERNVSRCAQKQGRGAHEATFHAERRWCGLVSQWWEMRIAKRVLAPD